MNSKEKGARGERLFAKELREYGYEAERGCQRAGGKDSPDVKCNMPCIHWEIKNTQKLRLYEAIAQSHRDAGENEMPLVAHKRNREPWYVTMELKDFMTLYKAWEELHDTEKTER